MLHFLSFLPFIQSVPLLYLALGAELPPMLGLFRHGLLNRCRLFSLFSLSNQTWSIQESENSTLIPALAWWNNYNAIINEPTTDGTRFDSKRLVTGRCTTSQLEVWQSTLCWIHFSKNSYCDHSGQNGGRVQRVVIFFLLIGSVFSAEAL